MIPHKAFYLIRHGETYANIAHISAGGGLDSPLTDRGHEQAMTVGRMMPGLSLMPSKVIHSSMSRARDTARHLNSAIGLEMEEMDDLKEHLLGEWEGEPWDAIMPKIIGNEKPRGGESRDEFSARVKQAVSRVLAAHNDDNPPIIVAHGGTFHAIMHLYGWAYNGPIRNCHLHYFDPHAHHAAFPWRVCQFDPDNDGYNRQSAPFCATVFSP